MLSVLNSLGSIVGILTCSLLVNVFCLPSLLPAAPRQHRKVPDALKELVQRCWDADYDKRPEMTEVIEKLQRVLKELPKETPIATREGEGCCSVQ